MLQTVDRINLSKFHCGKIKLHTVLGVINNIPIDECICLLCNNGDIGDE